MANGVTRVAGVLDSADVRSTVEAVRALGAHVTLAGGKDGSLSGTIRGWGNSCPATWEPVVDCGNSGTTARLLMGVLTGWPIKVTLTGDESLSKRPMRRVTEPLSRMGATFQTTDAGTLPITVHGAPALCRSTMTRRWHRRRSRAPFCSPVFTPTGALPSLSRRSRATTRSAFSLHSESLSTPILRTARRAWSDRRC